MQMASANATALLAGCSYSPLWCNTCLLTKDYKMLLNLKRAKVERRCDRDCIGGGSQLAHAEAKRTENGRSRTTRDSPKCTQSAPLVGAVARGPLRCGRAQDKCLILFANPHFVQNCNLPNLRRNASLQRVDCRDVIRGHINMTHQLFRIVPNEPSLHQLQLHKRPKYSDFPTCHFDCDFGFDLGFDFVFFSAAPITPLHYQHTKTVRASSHVIVQRPPSPLP